MFTPLATLAAALAMAAFGLSAAAEPVTLSAMDTRAPGWGHPAKHNYTFETVTGFFLQDLNSTDASSFDYIASNFGLASTAPLAWESFQWSIAELNRRAAGDVSYRVLFLARHGEGFHNVAEAQYGTPAWNDHWSKLDGDGTLTWGPDALLTPAGRAQAMNASAAWRAQLAAGAPRPHSFYSSPLTRSADTLNLTWAPLADVGAAHGPVTVVLEGLRETIGVHTCDQRRSRSWIAAREPRWAFERGFAEEDPFWTADDRETDGAQQARVRDALVHILDNDDAHVVSITAHSGTVGALLRALGHRPFSLATGAMIPVVIKATRTHLGSLGNI